MVHWPTRFDLKIISLGLIIGFLVSVGTIPAYADTISPIYPWPILGHDGQRTSYSEGPAPDNTELLWKTDYIGAGPITSADGRLFFSSSNYTEMWLFQINAYSESDGTINWSRTFRWRGDWPPNLPSLTIYEKKVYFAQGGTLYCLEESSGQVIWETTSTPVNLGRRFSRSPLVDGSQIFVTTDEGNNDYCFSFDSSNGKTLWGTKLKGLASIASVSTNSVLVNSYNSTSKVPYTECFDKEKGIIHWSHAFENQDMPFISYLQPPSISNDRVFVGLGSLVYSLNLATGDVVWESTVQGIVDTTPAIAYGKIFVASSDGYLYTLNQTTGELLWKYPIVQRVYQPIGWVSVADSKVFVTTGSPSTLYCINENDGNLNWFKNIGYGPYGICVSDGNLYASVDGIIYAFGSTIVSTRSTISLEFGQTSPTVPPIEISGSIYPPQSGVVEIQWSINKSMWYYQKATALNGRYSYPWMSPCNGTFYFKAVWGGDEVYSGATSVVKSVVFSGYDYAKLKSDLNRLNSSYIELEAVNHSLQSQVSSLQSDKTNLESQVSSLQSDKHALQSQVSSLQIEKNNLELQVASLQSDKNMLEIGLGAVIAIFLIVTVYLYSKRTRVRNQLP